jgi:hypothetical protein
MLNKHLEYIFVFMILAFGIHLKNSFFSSKTHNSLIQTLPKPNVAQIGSGFMKQVMSSKPDKLKSSKSNKKTMDLENNQY